MNERDLFIAALQIEDPAGRSAYLDQACGADAELRRRVEALLAAFAQAGNFLQQPAAEADATSDMPPAGPSLNGAPAEGPGSVIGPYKLLQQIGEGGMGVVFLAEQAQPVRRQMALKLIKSGMDSRQVIARFEAERQALALMDHPNIAKVFDAGTTKGGRPYFVMELVKGVPITKYCDERRLTPRQRLELFVPVCRAVQHAHQKGVIHRDLKPTNVLVCLYDGQPVPKVIDFGIAKAADPKLTEHTCFTEFGQVVGTFEYMSPEQAELSQLDIDTRSDIYALGVLLYELLTGTTPLERKRFRAVAFLEVLRLIREEEPPRPSTRLSTAEKLPLIAANRGLEPKKLSGLLRGELDWIVMKTLEKDRNRRYETANGLAMDLQRYLYDEPVLACPPSAWYRLRKSARRHKAALGIALAAALAVLFAVAGLALSNLRIQKEQERTEEALGQARREERAKTEQLRQALLAQARARRRSGQIGQRFEALDALREAARITRELDLEEKSVEELRTEAIACLALADLKPLRDWPNSVPRGYPTAFDPDLERYAHGDADGVVLLCRSADQEVLARLPPPRPGAVHVRPAFSPDGRFLAAGYWFRDHLDSVVWDLAEGGAPRQCLEVAYSEFAFRPDSGAIAVAQPDATVLLCDLIGGARKKVPAGDVGHGLVFRPDGRQLAFIRADGTLVSILDLETGERLPALDHADDVNVLAWSGDGRLLAAGSDDRNVYVWDVQARKHQAVLEGHQAPVYRLEFSPAGGLLASDSTDGTTRLWDPISGRLLVTAGRPMVRFSRDGSRLGFHDDLRLGTWGVADGQECRVLHHGRVGNRAGWLGFRGPESLAFSPNGRLLASAAGDGVRLWDVAAGAEAGHLTVGHHSAVVFHPDGDRLYTHGRTGLRCWPIRADPQRAPGKWEMGPPELLGYPGKGCFRLDISADGRRLAVSDYDLELAFVLNTERPAERVATGDCPRTHRLALSPDGRYLATGLWGEVTGVKVWDTSTGRLVKAFGTDHTIVAFGGGGLAVGGGGTEPPRLWQLDTWEPGPLLAGDRQGHWDGPVAFSRDGRLLAVTRSFQLVQLFDPATGRRLATLTAPDLPFIGWLGFSPDGSRLAAATESHTIHVWDLHALHRQLQPLGLAWEPAPEAPRVAAGGDRVRLAVMQDTYEAENLEVVASSGEHRFVQDMAIWGRENWSGGRQLCCFTHQGGYVEFEVHLPRAGRYRLAVWLTKALEYGAVEVALDGRKVGERFDGFHEVVLPPERMECGAFDLRAGSHRLRFTAVDRNPRSRDYFMGIDCLSLAPVDRSAAGRRGETGLRRAAGLGVKEK